MKSLLFPLLLSICIVPIIPPVSYQVLGLGDQVPDIRFDHVMNYRVGKANLYDFKGKLTILDFWSTSCGACVAYFPHMQALKDEFKDRLQIILVNGKTQLWHDDELKIARTLRDEEQNSGKALTLPIVYNCPELDSCFTYVAIPHEVWLDENGKIIAMTSSREVNEQNIRAILSGQRVAMHMKIDVPIDLQKETLQEAMANSGLQQRPQYASTLYKGYINGARGEGVRRDAGDPNGYTGLYLADRSLLNICEYAFSDVFSLPANQILVKVKDSTGFVRPVRFANDTSFYDNTWSYDLSVPPTSMENLRKYLRQDLLRVAGIHVVLTERPVSCVVLRSTALLQRSFSKGGPPVWVARADEPAHYVRNYSIRDVIAELNTKSPVPLIDSTGMAQAIDMVLPDRLDDETSLLEALTTAGFDIKQIRQMMKVAIITDE